MPSGDRGGGNEFDGVSHTTPPLRSQLFAALLSIWKWARSLSGLRKLCPRKSFSESFPVQGA
jgi:hypothetical protein